MPPRPRSGDHHDMIQPDEDSATNSNKKAQEGNASHILEETSRNNSSNAKRKFAVFGDSGMTDAERHELRQQQRKIATRLREECHDFDEVIEQRTKNNNLFKYKVRFPREAVLDADNVGLVVDKYSKQVEKNVKVPRYDASKLALKLVSKCSVKRGASHFFDWKTLGRECGVCFNAVPERVYFLAGSLDCQAEMKLKHARKTRQKEVIDESKEEEPEAVKNNRSDADQLSAAEKNLKLMKQILKSRSREQEKLNSSKDAAIDGVKFIFNPNSFTQTVENIFNFSFLIKKGDAEIGVKNDIGLYVMPKTHPTDDDYQNQQVSTSQAVVSFTMRDWRRILRERGMFEGDLPHRTGSKHAKLRV